MLRPNEPLGKGLSIVYDLLVLSILYCPSSTTCWY